MTDDSVSKKEVRDMIGNLERTYDKRLGEVSGSLSEIRDCLIQIKIDLGVVKNEQKHNNNTSDVIFDKIDNLKDDMKEMKENYYNCPARQYIEGMSVKETIKQHPVLSIGGVSGIVSAITLGLKILGYW